MNNQHMKMPFSKSHAFRLQLLLSLMTLTLHILQKVHAFNHLPRDTVDEPKISMHRRRLPRPPLNRKLNLDHVEAGSHRQTLEAEDHQARSIPDHRLDFVRLKLHSFVFEVHIPNSSLTDSSPPPLRNLMRPYGYLLLDPQYTSKMIASYNPIAIQSYICKLFQSVRSQDHAVTSLFVVNDFGTIVNQPRHDHILHLFFQIASSLGIPTITWMPNRIGQFELEDTELSVRFEPLTWHVARALADFLQAFNWNIAIVVYNVQLPGSKTLVTELKNLQEERSKQDHPNFFEFEFDGILSFDGITMSRLLECNSKKQKFRLECMGSLLIVLQKIWESVGRVIIFNGNQYDLNAILFLADNLYGTENEYLMEIFGEGYVWIFTPSSLPGLTVVNFAETSRTDSIFLGEFTMYRRIPGMFGLICLNDIQNREKHENLAVQVWHRAIMELVQQMIEVYPPQKPISLDPLTIETMAYYRELLEKLRPGNLCESNEHTGWQWGRRLSTIMRSLILEYDGEPVSFLPNGGLNVSKFLIFNSRTTTGKMNWYKVGTWSMSSKWGRSKSRLHIDGVTWPGGANAPPRGRSQNIRLRVAMLQEKPFLIYGKLQDDGTCDANSIKCWIMRESMQEFTHANTQFEIKRNLNGTIFRNKSAGHGAEISDDPMQTHSLACCTGLTMDLLLELIKDLNIDVLLYEVEDRMWGGWTPNGWNGLVRELLEHRADMVVTSMKITPNRSEQVDFSVPFLETGIAITVALREGAISPTAFLEPYDYQCWCIILVFSVHASGAAIYIYEWLSPAGLDRGRLSSPEHRFTLFRSLWLIWSMLFGAAVNADNPRGMASRFMANIWALFALVFLASYTANLAAFMISKDDFYDLNGINDWRLQQPWNHKPPFRFATVPSGATEENIKINFPEMSAYMRTFNRTTVIEGLKSLKSEEIDAFIYDATVLEYWTARDDGCKLKTVGNLYAMTGYGIAFPKGSRWLPKVNSRILNYQKNGKFQRWKQFWLSGACNKMKVIGNTNKTLGVKNFISAFILLLCGILLCAFIFLLEHAFYRYVWPRIRYSGRYKCWDFEGKQGNIVKCDHVAYKETRQLVSDLRSQRIDVTGCECKNSRCQLLHLRRQQEIAFLTRQLRSKTGQKLGLYPKEYLLNQNAESHLPEAINSQTLKRGHRRRPITKKLLNSFQDDSETLCKVIKIPRSSWAKDVASSNTPYAIKVDPTDFAAHSSMEPQGDETMCELQIQGDSPSSTQRRRKQHRRKIDSSRERALNSDQASHHFRNCNANDVDGSSGPRSCCGADKREIKSVVAVTTGHHHKRGSGPVLITPGTLTETGFRGVTTTAVNSHENRRPRRASVRVTSHNPAAKSPCRLAKHSVTNNVPFEDDNGCDAMETTADENDLYLTIEEEPNRSDPLLQPQSSMPFVMERVEKESVI